MKPATKPTICDVARRARVAVGTVSHYLNDRVPVSPEKRARIEEAVRALGYRPNILARSLSQGRAQIVAFAAMLGTRAYAALFFADVLSGVADAAIEMGWTIHYIPVERSDEPSVWNGRMLDAAAGTLVLDRAAEAVPWKEIRKRRHPVVVLNERHGGAGCVKVDNVEGGALAVRHLHRLGHRRIAVLGAAEGFGRRRALGAVRALADQGLKPEVLNTNFTAESATSCTRSLLDRAAPRRPTALFCSTDLMARSAIDVARGMGLEVPRDLSVVGFDDSIFAEEGSPRLTSVRQPAREMGRVGFGMLQDMLGGAAVGCLRLKPELVVRASTAAPAAP